MNIEINIQHAVFHVKNPDPPPFEFVDAEFVEVESDHVDPESYRKLQRAFDTLTATHTEQRSKYESLVADYNLLADALVTIDKLIDTGENPADLVNRITGCLNALGPISPF